MCEDLGETERCTGCGAEVEDGTTGCQAIMEEFLARDFSDPTYFSVHRMVVDTYARDVELYWYEANGIGRKEFKIKRFIE